MFKQWTSLGVVAVSMASLEIIFVLLLLIGQSDLLPMTLPESAPIVLGFLYMGTMFISTVLGVIAMIAGTSDEKSRRDARMGVGVLLVNGIQIMGFFLLIVAGAIRGMLR